MAGCSKMIVLPAPLEKLLDEFAALENVNRERLAENFIEAGLSNLARYRRLKCNSLVDDPVRDAETIALKKYVG